MMLETTDISCVVEFLRQIISWQRARKWKSTLA